ncbi:MAG: ATP-grasp domain-containing protein [Myxococcales bacterium]|nr:ATP-grasp domain-containing protein [Myxococcales bacterium]
MNPTDSQQRQPRLGILGGGQLARMLAEAALASGVEVSVLAKDDGEPAALPGVELIQGTIDEEHALNAVFARCGRITIENEFLDIALIDRVRASHPNTVLFPGTHSIGIAQDKLRQKELFRSVGIASAPYSVVPQRDLESHLRRFETTYPNGYVLKWSRFGYDGKGNYLVSDPKRYDEGEVKKFCEGAAARGAEVFAEEKVDFSSELAMVSTRAADGSQTYFPLVVSTQERGVCRETVGPAAALGVPQNLETFCQNAHRTIGQALSMVGTFALEFFLTNGGSILVNEMAPRVHNSGHYSLFNTTASQFRTHVEAVMGWPLSEPSFPGIMVMRNLLGPWDLSEPRLCPAPAVPSGLGFELYWYGKRTVSSGRKMGHLVGCAASPAELPALQGAMADCEERMWLESLRG